MKLAIISLIHIQYNVFSCSQCLERSISYMLDSIRRIDNGFRNSRNSKLLSSQPFQHLPSLITCIWRCSIFQSLTGEIKQDWPFLVLKTRRRPAFVNNGKKNTAYTYRSNRSPAIVIAIKTTVQPTKLARIIRSERVYTVLTFKNAIFLILVNSSLLRHSSLFLT